MPLARNSVYGLLVAAAVCCAGAWPARAHPHVWINAETTVLYENGTFTGLQHKWTFDEFYSSMEVEGLDTNNDGKLDREELAELARHYVTGLKDYSYFTYPALAGQKLALGEATDIWLEYTNSALSLHFTVPFAQPVLAEATGFTFAVYDPSFYIALVSDKADSVRLGEGTPKACRIGAETQSKEAASAKALTDAFSGQFGRAGSSAGKAISVSCEAP